MPLNVVVCGTNYGRVYLDAVARRPRQYRLVGVLARGSARSREVCRAYDTPLFTTVDAIPGSVDLACAALGRHGRETVLALLRRGIHVLCEHPQPPDFMKAAYAAASRSGAHLHVNGHFRYLEASRAFLRLCARRPPPALRFIELTVNDRCLYGALDILKTAAGALQPVSLKPVTTQGAVLMFSGAIARRPCLLQIESSLQPNGEVRSDRSDAYAVDYRIDLGFNDGILSLLSMNGPVTWKGRAFTNRSSLA